MLTPATVLAMMLTVGAPPGKSAYSTVRTGPDTSRLETRDEGLARYRLIATAIARVAGKDARLARLLVTVARHESDFRKDIHSCDKLGDVGPHYASRSLYQIKLHKRSKLGREICGTDFRATLRATRAAAKRIGRVHGRHCQSADCTDAFIRYSGLSFIVATTDPRYASKIVARGKTYSVLARPRPLPDWAKLEARDPQDRS